MSDTHTCSARGVISIGQGKVGVPSLRPAFEPRPLVSWNSNRRDGESVTPVRPLRPWTIGGVKSVHTGAPTRGVRTLRA